MDNYNLKEKWNLWYHSINDNNWTNSSYKMYTCSMQPYIHLNGIAIIYQCLDNDLSALN